MIPLTHYLILGAILFALSIIGIFLNRKNLLIILMSIELLLLAVNMNFVAFSAFNLCLYFPLSKAIEMEFLNSLIPIWLFLKFVSLSTGITTLTIGI